MLINFMCLLNSSGTTDNCANTNFLKQARFCSERNHISGIISCKITNKIYSIRFFFFSESNNFSNDFFFNICFLINCFHFWQQNIFYIFFHTFIYKFSVFWNNWSKLPINYTLISNYISR